MDGLHFVYSLDVRALTGPAGEASRALAALYHSPNSRKGLAGGVYLAAQLERQNALLEAILKATLRRPI